MVRPSGDGENFGKLLQGGFHLLGGLNIGECPPPSDVRHIMQGSLDHVEHVWARIPEAHVNLLHAVLAVTLAGCWIRGG